MLLKTLMMRLHAEEKEAAPEPPAAERRSAQWLPVAANSLVRPDTNQNPSNSVSPSVLPRWGSQQGLRSRAWWPDTSPGCARWLAPSACLPRCACRRWRCRSCRWPPPPAPRRTRPGSAQTPPSPGFCPTRWWCCTTRGEEISREYWATSKLLLRNPGGPAADAAEAPATPTLSYHSSVDVVMKMMKMKMMNGKHWQMVIQSRCDHHILTDCMSSLLHWGQLWPNIIITIITTTIIIIIIIVIIIIIELTLHLWSNLKYH